jgi:hypothetical protein
MTNWDTFDNDDLISRWVAVNKTLQSRRDELGRVEHELTQRMESAGATALSHSTHDVVLPPGKITGYDPSKMALLKEMLSPEDLKKVYTPAHEKMVDFPESWNGTGLRGVMRLGRAWQKAIEAGTLRARGRLKITEKKGT